MLEGVKQRLVIVGFLGAGVALVAWGAWLYGACTMMAGALVAVAAYLEQGRRKKLPPPDDPRWGAGGRPQIAGRQCAECGQKIALEREGDACKACGVPCHTSECVELHTRHAHAPDRGAPFR